jgi:hypothetical protein
MVDGKSGEGQGDKGGAFGERQPANDSQRTTPPLKIRLATMVQAPRTPVTASRPRTERRAP